MPRQTVFYDLKGTANASGTCTLRSNRLKRGQLLCVQCVSARQDDNNNVKVKVMIDRAGTSYEIVTLDLASKGRTYAHPHPVYLDSECQLRLDFSSAGSAGVCNAWFYGYLEEM
jgi:microcompartment protein CcmK/EutM